MDVFSSVVEFNPSILRDFFLKEIHKQDDVLILLSFVPSSLHFFLSSFPIHPSQEDLLINMVIEQMFTDLDPGEHHHHHLSLNRHHHLPYHHRYYYFFYFYFYYYYYIIIIIIIITMTTTELGGALQLIGVIRLLVDPDNMNSTVVRLIAHSIN